MNLFNEIFVLALATLFCLVFAWGFRTLPAEGWQMMASIPVAKDERGVWRGLNLTFYGAFVATACAFGAAMLLILMAACGASLLGVACVVVGLTLGCSPAARLLARIIEGKRHTLTVSGAAFVGALATPFILRIVNQFIAPRFGFDAVASAPLFAALAIAYAFSEAIGRLACISFGCCYGKPLAAAPVFVRRLFQRRHFIFTGATKKVVYEGALAGAPVVPIQAMTATLFTLIGLIAVLLFLHAKFVAALLVALLATQSWRILSEFLRADFRGTLAGGKLTAYQIMSALMIVYALALLPRLEIDARAVTPDILTGLRATINLPTFLSLEILWLFVFWRVGRSSVTDARLSFHVVRERI